MTWYTPEWVPKRIVRRVKEVDPRHQERRAANDLRPRSGQIAVASLEDELYRVLADAAFLRATGEERR